MVNYQLKEEEIIDEIGELQVNTVGIQFPDGLRVHATSIAQKIEESTGATVIISGDACYGACDLSDRSMEHLVEVLVHFGHTPLPLDYKVPIIFVEAFSNMQVLPIIKEAIESLDGYEKIGLVTTTQHLHLLDDMKDCLEANGKQVLMSEGKGTLEGQVLGCNFSSASSLPVEAFLYVGSGNFHPIGLQLSTDKPVIVADPYMNEVRKVDDLVDRMLRIRFAKIARSMDAQNFGIIVSSKTGQHRLELARSLKGLIEDNGKHAFLILMENINQDLLMSFRDLEAFIVTACPRIAIDDAQLYDKPLLTPMELEVVLGIREWEDYGIDEIIYE